MLTSLVGSNNKPHTLAFAAVDPKKIERELMNLLSNAFKFVPYAGLGTCTVEARPGEIMIAVDDSGPGASFCASRAIDLDVRLDSTMLLSNALISGASTMSW